MKKESLKRHIVGSIENTSILRKFTILFLVMSVIPMLIIWYLYLQIRDNGTIQITAASLNVTLLFVVFGVVVGYMAMRSVLQQIIDLTNKNRMALGNVFGIDKTKELLNESNEIAILSRSFSEITHRLEENVRSLEEAKKTLHSVMAKVGEGISNMENIDTFLELILETVTDALSGRVGVLMLIDERKNEFWIKTVYGIEYDGQLETRMKIDEGTSIHSVVKSKKPFVIPKMIYGTSESKKHSYLFEAPIICAPLIVHDHVSGVIAVSGSKNNSNFADEELNLLSNLASQTAIALENAQLNSNIELTYFETISALALAVDAKDKYSRGHLDRVANHCIQIAKKLGLEDEDIKTLNDAARLHDLGKIGIPDEVLCKPGKLNEQEWILMQKHPEIGESIIKPIRSLNNLCDIIRHHHEKLDGSGYPDGLKGDQITSLVRITTIADIYDALTTDRPYRSKMTSKEACVILRQMKKEIDQDIVEAFIESLNET